MDDAIVDVLGEPYRSETIEFPPDSEGAVVATLVSRRAHARTGHAVLYLHGFCDYFFQTNLADFYVARGYDFYALDLRKYGRSLREHHTPNFCTDLADYFPELDGALRLMRERDGQSHVVVNGHSTGALIGAIWADARRARGRPVAEGFVLNSPWLDLAGSLAMRTVGTAVVKRLGRMQPYRVIPRTVTPLYVEGMHRDFRGEWEFDLAWKPASSFPVRAGWIAAVRRAHAALHAGIDVGAPVLVLRSARSSVPREWDDRIQSTNTSSTYAIWPGGRTAWVDMSQRAPSRAPCTMSPRRANLPEGRRSTRSIAGCGRSSSRPVLRDKCRMARHK